MQNLAFFRSHRSGHHSRLQKRIEIIRNGTALTSDAAIISTHQVLARALCRQMLSIIECTDEFDKRINKIYASHSDAPIFNSLPASGEILAPRLLAAMGSDRSRFNSADELERFSGIAPVLVRSGNQTWIRWRYSCNKFLRQSFHEWAGVTIQHSLWARAYYAMCRAKGKSHSVAVRALAYKWIRIIYKLWKDKITYSETAHLAQLQRTGSPIIKFLAENPNLENIKFSTI